MLKIAITDDHQLFRESLKLLINGFENMTVTLEAENGQELIDRLDEEEIDIILLDLEMPVRSGVETCAWLKKNRPEKDILILSQFSGKSRILKMLEMGVQGYFSKGSNPSELKQALVNIKEKGFHLEENLQSHFRDIDLEQIKFDEIQEKNEITKREMEIIRLGAKDYTTAEMANALHISVRTVEKHRRNLIVKTESNNFLGVILYALKNHLIHFPSIFNK